MAAESPVMAQYQRIKASYPDALLLFRMGDFYETFYEDAHTAAGVLGIALTSRQKTRDGESIPLAGIPWRTLDSYLARLLRAGHKVAVCEQVSDPRAAKGLVDREVVEVVTAGTAVAEGLVPERRSNYLASLRVADGRVGLAFADLAGGELWLGECGPADLEAEWLRFAPCEVIEVEGGTGEVDRLAGLGLAFARVRRPAEDFDPGRGMGLLRGRAPVEAPGFEPLQAALAALAALERYLAELHKSSSLALGEPRRFEARESLLLDAAARRNLEIFETTGGLVEGSLLKHLDQTVTAAGARHLRGMLERPLCRPEAIRERQAMLEALLSEPSKLRALRAELTPVPDLERLLGRLGAGRSSPRDLGRVRDALRRMPRVREATEAAPSALGLLLALALAPPDGLPELLERALEEDLPLVPGDAPLIRAGHDPEVDRLRDLARGGKEWLGAFEAREREATGIAGLKAGYHQVFGYYLEVTRRELEKVPAHYARRQTLASAERFVTEELKDREREILAAEDSLRRREQDLYEGLRAAVQERAATLLRAARALGELDALASLAQVSMERGYARPDVDTGLGLEITDLRHPVLEAGMPPGQFVPNDVRTDPADNQILLLTGPNMAGKSTYLRSVGQAVVMAQAGCFLPAQAARVGVVDRIFTRMGASDDITRGASTFWVEMREVSTLLEEASPRSLLLLDEVGRGTSTYDGMSLAWALLEHLHETPRLRARTLFATHYHELTDLASTLARLRNLHCLVREWQGGVTFLRRIVPGAASRSYGIEVARLAGVGEPVLRRAKELLRLLERRSASAGLLGEPVQLTLFDARRQDRAVLEALETMEIDRMTPLEALARLHELRTILLEDAAVPPALPAPGDAPVPLLPTPADAPAVPRPAAGDTPRP
ncbi:MAG: DNA mismatch repair protein MutS [Candidatus Eisenbacteria bacterium]|nr:DNA mismatch repair protein MutS [Candidatus Eisenbacteria bacterium]